MSTVLDHKITMNSEQKLIFDISFISHDNTVRPVLCEDRHLHSRIISPGVEVWWINKTSLTPSLYIEVPVPNLERVLGIPISPHSMIFLLVFGTVRTAYYILVFIYHHQIVSPP